MFLSTQTSRNYKLVINPLTPNDHYSGRTAPLTSKRCILYIYSTNISTEYFKHGIYSPFFPLQNAVCFIILTYLVPVLFIFYMQVVLKFKKNHSGAKRLRIGLMILCTVWQISNSKFRFTAMFASSNSQRKTFRTWPISTFTTLYFHIDVHYRPFLHKYLHKCLHKCLHKYLQWSIFITDFKPTTFNSKKYRFQLN